MGAPVNVMAITPIGMALYEEEEVSFDGEYGITMYWQRTPKVNIERD